jgi:glycosyltransferase 2 family protein
MSSADVQPDAAAEKSSRRQAVFLLLSFLLAAILLYLSVRKVDWKQVWSAIAHCKFDLLAISMAMSAFSYFLRGLRWRVLLNTQAKLPVFTVFWANSAGYLGNNVLPARAGELIRTAMVSSRSQLSKTFVLTTALAERLMDAIVLVVSGTVVLRFVPNKPDWLATLSTPLLVVGCSAAVLIISIPALEAPALRLLGRFSMAPKVAHRLESAIEHIASGIRAFHDPTSFALFLLLTIAIWGMDSYAITVLAHALGMQISIAVALLLLVGLGVGSALPSTPGYIGIYQFVAVTVLVPFHFTRSAAIAFILVAQAGGLVVTGVLGLAGLLQYRKLTGSGSV